ncbi:hypothetical protein AB6A40_004945 [Gnathostoma spinigerum]|uniref:Uncharacterized protein n=1 Tax=Gnathostoma spinigerum TaxID=75299 RepID=A0ABD6ELE0_9BILA
MSRSNGKAIFGAGAQSQNNILFEPNKGGLGMTPRRALEDKRNIDARSLNLKTQDSADLKASAESSKSALKTPTHSLLSAHKPHTIKKNKPATFIPFVDPPAEEASALPKIDETAEEQFNRVDPDAPIESFSYSATEEAENAKVHIPDRFRDDKIGDLFCDMIAVPKFRRALFSRLLTVEQINMLENDEIDLDRDLDIDLSEVIIQ